MKHILSAVLLLLSTTITYAVPTKLNISDAIEQNIITVKAETNGNSFMRQGLTLKIKNNGSLNFVLIMNFGTVFKCETDGYSSLILAGEETMFINPMQENIIIDVQTFSADSKGKVPEKGLSYTYSNVDKSIHIEIFKYIKQRRLYSELGQYAIWLFTNDHNINSVYAADNDAMSKQLIERITEFSTLTTPEYFVEQKISKEAGKPVFNPKVLNIFTQVEHQIKKTEVLTLAIYNSTGEQVQTVFENRRYGKSTQRFRVQFNTENNPAGKYYIRLKDESDILKETLIEIL
ncbi:MAG: hypothetical protein H6551_01465 [Chitinophagales bacterium]|nr:hypothetical protein [Chitinophagaceae bacterium]MCB9063792.1 hypothetical protein [Chitinophagales bacterium]